MTFLEAAVGARLEQARGGEPGHRLLHGVQARGFDGFLAARQVGPTGRVIGVDMTPEMVAKARDNARRADCGSPCVTPDARRPSAAARTLWPSLPRGLAPLRSMLDACCRIALDARGHVIECEPR